MTESDVVSFATVNSWAAVYWLCAGVVSVLVFLGLEKNSFGVNLNGSHASTRLTKVLFFFMFGGALLPLLILLLPPLVAASFFGAKQEQSHSKALQKGEQTSG